MKSGTKDDLARRAEIPVDLQLWLRDGVVRSGNDSNARSVNRPFPCISIGRTNSKRRLGVAVKMNDRSEWVLFTLDLVQVKKLRSFLDYQLRRLKKRPAVRPS